MIKKLLVTFVLLFPVTLFAQNTTTSGTITLQAASCAGASAGYVYYILPTNTSAVAVTISGTWSATLQFVGSVNGTTWTSVNATPIPTASAVTSTTANGTWTINPAGLAEVCVYASSYASGKAQIAASAQTGVASGGYVAQIVAGTGITLSPSGGTGNVTINAASGAAAGSTSQLQYNNSGAFAGASGGTTSGTHFAFGEGSLVDNGPTGDPTDAGVFSPDVIALFQENETVPTNGMFLGLTVNPATPTADGVYGLRVDTQTSSSGPAFGASDIIAGLAVNDSYAGTSTGANAFGVLANEINDININSGEVSEADALDFGVYNTGSGTIDLALGAALGISNTGSGTIGEADALVVGGYTSTAGTTTTARGVWIQPPELSGAAAITTNIGLDIQEQCGAGITNCMEIDSEGTGPSDFAGMVYTAGLVETSAAPTVTSGQVGFGGTTAAASNCNNSGALTAVAGCLIINVARTTHYVPYF